MLPNVKTASYGPNYITLKAINQQNEIKNFIKIDINFPKMTQSKFLTLREKCPYSELFWSGFSRIQTEYGEQSECRKMRTRITPNTDTFYAV